ncbi:hypothetical protein [Pseudomonas sp. TWP3-2]|uniref:hypothetical protein n=1 Tax=Pseudomonas sp. TWP3-2 TaxID=2804574 RepID=UPI003CF7BBF6
MMIGFQADFCAGNRFVSVQRTTKTGHLSMSGFRDFAKEQTNMPRDKRGKRGTALAWNADSATECVEDLLHHFTCFVLFKCECVLLLEPTINPTTK